MIEGLVFKGVQQRSPFIFNLGDGDFFDTITGSDDPYGFNKFTGYIKIEGYSWDDEEEDESYVDVGEICFNAYNLGSLNFDCFCQDWKTAIRNSELYDAMDMDSSDAALYYSVFEEGYNRAISDIFPEDWDDMIMLVNEGYLITLDRVYIKPEYRKMGIGKFIHEHLFKILYTEFNIIPFFAVGICVPDKGEPDNMLEVQKKVLTDNDFDVFECYNETAFCKYIFDIDFLESL